MNAIFTLHNVQEITGVKKNTDNAQRSTAKAMEEEFQKKNESLRTT